MHTCTHIEVEQIIDTMNKVLTTIKNQKIFQNTHDILVMSKMNIQTSIKSVYTES